MTNTPPPPLHPPPHQLLDVIRNTEELKLLQETPDPPEALKCIPTLQLSDIPATVTIVPTVRLEVLGLEFEGLEGLELEGLRREGIGARIQGSGIRM